MPGKSSYCELLWGCFLWAEIGNPAISPTQLLGQTAPVPFSPCSPHLAPQQAARLSRAADAGLSGAWGQFLQSRMWSAWKSMGHCWNYWRAKTVSLGTSSIKDLIPFLLYWGWSCKSTGFLVHEQSWLVAECEMIWGEIRNYCVPSASRWP